MSIYDELLVAVQTQMATVPNVGSIQLWERYSPKRSDQLDHYMVSINGVDQIRGWVITLDESTPITTFKDEFDGYMRTVNLLIMGFMTLQDETASEREFINLVISVMDALQDQIEPTLSDANTHLLQVQPISARLYQLRTLGQWLCHWIEIVVPVEITVQA